MRVYMTAYVCTVFLKKIKNIIVIFLVVFRKGKKNLQQDTASTREQNSALCRRSDAKMADSH
jgi:hypothetical protein